jgi:alpha-tubulin suppressor-like RCC1 family protein
MRNLMEVSAGDGFNLGLKPGGTVIAWGSNNFRQATVPENLQEVTAIAAGSAHALALRSDGTVVAWGDNRHQQAAPPEDLRDVVAISAGHEHSLALHSDGTVSAWGSNRQKQTDVPEDLEEVVAISAGHSHSLALKKDGTVVAWGLNADGQAEVPANLTDVVEVAAGGFHSLALQRDGTLVAWGNNAFGQASFPKEVTGVLRIEAGRDHSLLLLEDGRLMVWGRNHYGQTSRPIDIAPARRVAAGANHNVVLLETGDIAAWGNNDFGQALNPQDLASAVQLAAWDNHTVALKEDGTVFWWGVSLSGGIPPNPTQLRDVVAVAAGRAHGLALRANGTVLGWGDNLYGQATPPKDLRDVVAIAAGEFHSLALRSDGTVAAWGNNFQEQSSVPRGLGKVIAISAGQEHSMAVREGGLVFVWGNDFHGQRAIPAGLERVISLAGGSFHNVALRNNGTLAAWGSDLFGQTALPAGISDIVAVAAGRSHSVALRADRTLIGWGGDHYGQSTAPPGLGPVLDLAAGSSRTVVITGELKPPRFVNRVESRIVPAGEDVFVLPLLQGTGPLRYQWMKNGRPIQGATGPALSLRRVSAADSGSYWLIAANPAGQTTSQAFSIEVEDPAVGIGVRPRVAVLEEPAIFTARVRGTGPFQYQWKKDGEPIAQATESTFQLESVQEEDTGIYTVEVSNAHASTTSDPLQFLVEPRINGQPPEIATARIGERLTLEIDASGSPPLQVQWLRDNTPIAGATEKALVLENVGVSHGGVYRAVVSNSAGRVFSEETLLQISPHIVFQPESQVFSSFRGTAVFEVRAIGTPPLTYHWMKDGQLLVRSPEPRLVLDEVQADDAGEYYVVVINNAGRAESERASLVLPPSISRHPASAIVRAGEQVEFTVRAGGSRPLKFQWLKDGEPIAGEENGSLLLEHVEGKDTGRYAVIITNEVGSITSQPGTLSVSPHIVNGPAPVSARNGQQLLLQVEAIGSEPLHYQWAKDGVLLQDSRDSFLTIDNLRPEDAGSYSVVVSNSAGISVSEPVRVDVE